MKREKIRLLTGKFVCLHPTAFSVDECGRAHPGPGDSWFVEAAGRWGVRVRNTRTDHIISLGPEHIAGFDRSGCVEGVGRPVGTLKLRHRVTLTDHDVHLTPIERHPLSRRAVVLPLAGTGNPTAEAVTWLALGVFAVAALEHWSAA